MKNVPAMFVGLVLGVILGWVTRENRDEIAAAVGVERCGYAYPHSGPCDLPKYPPHRHTL